jgi:hypothetical protein
MPDPSESRPQRKRGEAYSEEEIERGLVEVAMCAGNTRRAHRQLEARGLTIPRETLKDWTTRHHLARYEEVRLEVLPRVHAKLAQESEDLAREYAAAEHAALDRFRAELPNLRAADAASAVRNLATSRGISLDKAHVLRGRPSSIVERRDPAEIVDALARLGVTVSINNARDPRPATGPTQLPPGT